MECTLRRTDECYNELPVTFRNQSFFLSTISRTLIRTGTHIECNPMLPAEYWIDGTWYRFTPHPVEVLPPGQLHPASMPTWGYNPIGNLASSGIYSDHEINQLRDRIMFPAEKPALLNNIARGFAGRDIPPGSVSLKTLMDEDALQHVADGVMHKIWGGFEKFGIISAGLFGVLAILTIIKAIIDTCIHGYTLHTLYGWSFTLLGAIWNSVTSLLISRAHHADQRSSKITNDEPLELVSINDNRDHPTTSRRLSGVDHGLLERLNAGPQQS